MGPLARRLLVGHKRIGWRSTLSTISKPGLDWPEYYRITRMRPSRELFRAAVRLAGIHSNKTSMAIDIGSGAGVEALELLRQGWSVHAIDPQPAAITFLRSAIPSEHRDRCTTILGAIESQRLPKADFIWAGASLPFLTNKAFASVWRRIVSSLKDGGIFAGDIFGSRHAWSKERSMNFHSSREVKAILSPLRIDYLVSEEGHRMTAMDGVLHWHAFGVIASKPTRPIVAPKVRTSNRFVR